MTGEKGNTMLKKLSGYLIGIIAGVITTIGFIYILNASGFIAISSVGKFSLAMGLRWVYGNLGLSIIPFSLIAAGFFIYLGRLISKLSREESFAEDIYATDEKIDLLMNIFFGVGVIWTAIGMRNALLASLGNIDAEIAAQKGAFYILTQLVDGGILLSLSTTIVGGVGGYIMRMIKAWSVGVKLNAFADAQMSLQHTQVLTRLDRIAELLQPAGEDSEPC